eukprot:TRINITY_DN6891_c2_g1_i1.p3 TRINITY_DN6891_c2_g1~~TRINITY_DN6891_c2_g1_i1.p3  ORF type:complete len:129 (+),score=32.54 TRINITY_DN6891_c2_g1_i1:177-563(+)
MGCCGGKESAPGAQTRPDRANTGPRATSGNEKSVKNEEPAIVGKSTAGGARNADAKATSKRTPPAPLTHTESPKKPGAGGARWGREDSSYPPIRFEKAKGVPPADADVRPDDLELCSTRTDDAKWPEY